MSIIPYPKENKSISYKAGVYGSGVNHPIGTTPSTVDLSNADYLQGILIAPENETVYGAWGDTVNTSTASIMIDDTKAVFDYGSADPLPSNNLTFLSTGTNALFNYQTAEKVIII